MAENIEFYVKEKNLLQLPLFYFGKERKEKMLITWSDSKGDYTLKCTSDDIVPGAFDQDVYTATMRVWIKQGMPHGSIKLTYTDIARELNFKKSKDNLGRIKNSLERLGKARYELFGCFVRHNGNQEGKVIFSLFDSVVLHNLKKGSKNKKFTELYFPDVIRENLEAKYYQKLDMSWYRELSSGLSRRLYEYLEKRRYHKIKGKFTISEEAICRWLPITDSHKTNRRKTLSKIANTLIKLGYLSKYELDKKKGLTIFTYVENARVSKKETCEKSTPKSEKKHIKMKKKTTSEKQNDQLSFLSALDWVSSVPYFQKKKRNEIASLPMNHIITVYPKIKLEYEETLKKGKHLRPHWIYNEFMKNVENFNEEPSKTVAFEKQINFYEGDEDEIDNKSLNELFALLKKPTKSLKKQVDTYLKTYGFNHVKNNILYANKHAKKSYSGYLAIAIKDNFGEGLAEEKEMESALKEQNKKRQKEQEEKDFQEALILEKKEKEFEEQRNSFIEKVKTVSIVVRNALWEKANNSIRQDAIGREMNVKIEYKELLLENFKSEGVVFHQEAMKGLEFIKKIAELDK